MNEDETSKCPKCDGRMVEGKVGTYGGIFKLKKHGAFVGGDTILAFYCEDCGYIELYKKMKKGKDVKP